MTPQSQKDEIKRSFQKVFRGYDPSEVDSYINALTENYNALYRDYAELEHKLSEANDKLSDITGEEEKVKKTLDTARAAADKIVADAYERSDAILASIKRSCDKILRSFRDKTEAHKLALSSMQESILVFKNELFERYRLHIELIEQLSPVFEYEEDLTPQQYVEKVVSAMNRDVSAEFGINIGGFDVGADETDAGNEPEEKALSETMVFDSQPKLVTDAAEEEKPVEKKPQKPKKKSGKRSKKSAVISLIDEYETPGVINIPKETGVQMSFDFDSACGSLSDTH